MFCVDTEHAARMRQALVNENSDLCTQYPRSSAAARAFTRTRRSTTSRWWSHRRSRPPRSRRTPGDRRAASRNTHHAGAAGTRGRQAPRKDRPQGGRTPGRAPARFPGPSIEALEDSAFLLTIAWSRDHVHVGVAKPTWSRPPCDNPNPRQLGATPPPHRGDDSRDGPAPSWRAADGLAVVVRCWCP